MLRQHRKSAKLICRIDDSAFAGVMFALVAMFLLPATIVIDSPRDAEHAATDLVAVSHSVELQKALREDALFVAVQRTGRIWFDTDTIAPDQLPAAIRERLSHGAERKVYIKADARTKYESLN